MTSITTRSRSRSSNVCSDRFTSTEANAPHFFKVIHPLILQVGRLRIPKKFIGKYGKDLSDRVFLKVPRGNLWQVELKNSNGEVWLKSGWKEFAEHYSIDLWHFLVFRYDGNSRFHVLIFDMSASEIEYPPPVPTTIPEERTKMKFEDGGGSESMVPAKRKQVTSDADKERSLQISLSAKDFTSKNPFFMVTMRPSYVSARSGLNIPLVFADRYLRKTNESGNVRLQVADGRVWSVKCILSTNYVKLSSGWIAFARDNYLEVGDVCVFELVNGVQNLLNVVVFRAAEAAN